MHAYCMWHNAPLNRSAHNRTIEQERELSIHPMIHGCTVEHVDVTLLRHQFLALLRHQFHGMITDNCYVEPCVCMYSYYVMYIIYFKS